MRVEQRIGRIDRIGQSFSQVWISNYFYQGTIEDQVYQRLADRIHWFETVIGELQPILAEVGGEVTRQLAMLPLSEREAFLEQEIKSLRDRIQSWQLRALPSRTTHFGRISSRDQNCPSAYLSLRTRSCIQTSWANASIAIPT